MPALILWTVAASPAPISSEQSKPTHLPARGKTPAVPAAQFVDITHADKDGRAKEFWRFVEDQAADDEFFNE